MLLDTTQEDKKLYVSYYNLNGDTRFKIYDLKPSDMFNWVICDDNDRQKDKTIKNWDGKSVKKIKTKYLSKFRIIEYVKNKIPESDKKLIFDYHFPNIYFVDIEVETTDVFPEPSKANNKITSICIVAPNNKCIVFFEFYRI